MKIRPTEDEVKEMEELYPTKGFQKGWDSYFKNKPDKVRILDF